MASAFSYTISRPYPFRWFTPLAILVLVVFTALFTFFNFLSTGYIPQVQISTNPNVTEAGYPWLRSWPSFVFNVRPSCQVTNIPVGSQVFTNQTALTYTLTTVTQINETGRYVLSSLPYFNNVLQDCKISSIDIDIEADDRNAAQVAYNMYGETVRSYIQCSTTTPGGMITFNMTQEYDYVPADISIAYVSLDHPGPFLATNFLERDNASRASLWWGESLMSAYWGIVSGELQTLRESVTITDLGSVRKGTLYLAPQGYSDISQSDFFHLDFRIMGTDGGWRSPGDYDYDPMKDHDGVALLNRKKAYPDIWTSADKLAKSAYSTVLTDLGQDTPKSNVLTNPDLLQDFTEVYDDLPFHANANPGPATESYDKSKDSTGPLGITSSVLSTEYICEVPKQKSISNLFVSILVADAVFISVVWRSHKWIVETFFLRKDLTAQYCRGCVALTRDGFGRSDITASARTIECEKGMIYTSVRPSSKDRSVSTRYSEEGEERVRARSSLPAYDT